MLHHNQQQFQTEDKAVIHNFLCPVLENASEMDTPIKSGASKSRPRWAEHTRIGNVWEYPPPRASPWVLYLNIRIRINQNSGLSLKIVYIYRRLLNSCYLSRIIHYLWSKSFVDFSKFSFCCFKRLLSWLKDMCVWQPAVILSFTRNFSTERFIANEGV